MGFKLRQLQEDILDEILVGHTRSNGDDVWKIMVCDPEVMEVLDALWVSPKERLRARGITFVMSWEEHAQIVGESVALSSKRRSASGEERDQPLRSVEIHYFISPAEEKIRAIAKSCLSGKFRSVSLAFFPHVPTSLLQLLASELALSNPSLSSSKVSRISKIQDAEFFYSAVDNDCFSLNLPGAFKVLYDASSAEKLIDLVIDRIVSGLASAMISLRAIPIIRAQRGGPAEAIATRLNGLLRETLVAGGTSPFARGPPRLGYRRPVLILVDRTLDLRAVLHQDWSYTSLLHNVLGMSNGKVRLPSCTRKLERDDTFWIENRWNAFPQVAENIEKALSQYRSEVEEINSLKSREPGSDGDGSTTAHLANALASLPDLTRRKDTIDKHTEIATELLERVKKRGLDVLIELEGNLLMRSSYVDKAAVLSGISDGRGTKADKLRLFALFFLSAAELSTDDVEQTTQALKNAGCDLRLLEFLLRFRKPSPPTKLPLRPPVGVGVVGGKGTFVKSLLANVVDRGVKGLTQAAAKAKERITRVEGALPLSNLVQSIVEGHSPSSSDYISLDPKSLRNYASDDQLAQEFSHAIVVPIGGGSHFERDNVRRHVKGKEICYGSTAIYTCEDFLAEVVAIENAKTP